MRRLKPLHLLISFILIVFWLTPSEAQMSQRAVNQVSIVGWTDNSHYKIRNFDSAKNPVIQNVDIKTGKSEVIQPSLTDKEIMSKSLPSGTSLSSADVLSPDKKSAVIQVDNDLFFFTIGDKELKRLTNDKTT